MGNMLDTPPNERQYVEFKDRYNAIETDLRELVMKNEIRPLNEQSTAQSKIALTLWEGDQKKHRINDGFSDYLAEAHREQYLKIFTAMAKGEAIKEK
ncbi:hypothetical protein GTU79_03580 [Sodalis ligni]|uniref:hypothetical protein n=1 Tax=Sodalis ligni TaxID=2697027 RepID=UPI001BDE8E0D|nr:hypothetical protein [Sodalis ligni]QWA11884.1 hypothetical protein GTU79_03580 [Sodalis ligni]